MNNILDLSESDALASFVVGDARNQELEEVYVAGSDEEDVFELQCDVDDYEDVDETPATVVNIGQSPWSDGVCQPTVPQFRGNPGPTFILPNEATPFDYFREFVTADLMQLIADKTNRYATTFMESATLSPRSRYHKWTATTVNEMWAFLGLVTAMGLIPLADIDDYWSKDALYSLPFFPSTMNRDRFKLLLTFLHFSNNATQVARGQDGHDPLHKLAPFLNSIQEKFNRNYYPQKNLALDEAMVAWRGNIHFRVYSPAKPDKYGIKLYEICDSGNGYCCRFEVYVGKRLASPHGITYDLVMRLMEPYLDAGHHLYVDNYYTSPTLFQHLLGRDTPACGTLRLNKVGVAPAMKGNKVVKKKGDDKFMTNGVLNHIKFFDRKEVNVLTTIHTDRKKDTGRKDRITGERIIRHEAVDDYNKYMGAVDRSDQVIQNGAFRQKTMKWWKKLFFRLFTLAELNTYLFYKETMARKGKPAMEYKIFRRELAKEMVSQIPTVGESTFRRSAKTGDSSVHRLTARHFPSKVKSKRSPQQPLKRKSNPLRLCVVCSTVGCKKRVAKEKKKRKESTFECTTCDVGLCATPCFEIYHTQKDYKRAQQKCEEVKEETA